MPPRKKRYLCYIGSMELFDCPYLGAVVELTDEREAHIHEQHDELLPGLYRFLRETLEFPHVIQRSTNNARIFSRWHTNLRNGKYLIVIVGAQAYPTTRHFIITAYPSDELRPGEIEWTFA